MEKVYGGPETATAEQPKLTTTATVNRIPFHGEIYCESRAKVMTSRCDLISHNVDRCFINSRGKCNELERIEIAEVCHFGVTNSVGVLENKTASRRISQTGS